MGVIMGVTITAKDSEYDFSCGYHGFMHLRENIANAWDGEFGMHYKNLKFYSTLQKYDLWDRVANKILSRSRFKEGGSKEHDEDIVDFLLASDCEGEISYETCKKIYDLIKDIDYGDEIFTYVAYSDGKDYEHFKDFLLDCYKRRENMEWS